MLSHFTPHRIAPISTLRTHSTLVAERVTAHFVDSRVTADTCRTAEERACLLQADFSLTLSGAMASSAVFSVLYVHNEVGNQAVTSTGAHTHYGDATNVHGWEFRTRLRIAGKTGDQYIEAKPMDCVVMHSSQHKKLASIICVKLSMEDRVVSTR